MTAVIAAREAYKDLFAKKHGIKLGFMSFFAKAACLALKDVPAVNARIEGDEIVYHDYVDISVAVSAPNGLVVPVVRNADAMSFAEIEQAIADYGQKAKDGTLTMADMTGGTFTISNGGVFGSLMSTPIINPPQSAVLGLHRIEDRPVARDGQVVIRPMMYLALSYDHRLIDGREAVTALKIIKEAIEDPMRLLIDCSMLAQAALGTLRSTNVDRGVGRRLTHLTRCTDRSRKQREASGICSSSSRQCGRHSPSPPVAGACPALRATLDGLENEIAAMTTCVVELRERLSCGSPSAEAARGVHAHADILEPRDYGRGAIRILG